MERSLLEPGIWLSAAVVRSPAHGRYLPGMAPPVKLSYLCSHEGWRQVEGDAYLLDGSAVYRVHGPLGQEQRILQARFIDNTYRRGQSENSLSGGLAVQKLLELFVNDARGLDLRQPDGTLIAAYRRLSLVPSEGHVTIADQDGIALADWDEGRQHWSWGQSIRKPKICRALWIASTSYFFPLSDRPQPGPRSRLSSLAARVG